LPDEDSCVSRRDALMINRLSIDVAGAISASRVLLGWFYARRCRRL